MDPGATGCDEITIYAHVKGRFPYRNGSISLVEDVVSEQRYAVRLYQQQCPRLMPAFQAVALELQIPHQINIDRSAVYVILYDIQ